MTGAIGSLRQAIALALVSALCGSAGCATGTVTRTRIDMETEFRLDSPNFKTTAVHVSGRATCHYILFSIPLCRRQDVASVFRGAQVDQRGETDAANGRQRNTGLARYAQAS